MKINRTILITSGITALVCGSIYMMRANNNSKLKEELLDQRGIVEKLEIERRDSGRHVSRSGPEQIVDAIARYRAETTSDQRIEQAYARVEALLVDEEEFSTSSDQLLLVLSDVFRLLRSLDVDELIAVADKIEAPLVFEQRGVGKGSVKIFLLLLAGEEKPEQILHRIVKEGEPQMVPMALANLARKDPRAAMGWVKNADFSESERSEFMKMVTLHALNSDFEVGLGMLKQDGDFDLGQMMALSQIPIPSKMLDQVVAALRRPENAEERSSLTNLVLNSSMFHSGVRGAREAVRKYELPKEEVSAFLRDTGAKFSQSDPAGTIEWMMEVQPAGEQGKSVPLIVKGWASQDYKAAAKFLDSMKPSPVRDLSTEQFVKTVADLDPEAAAIWSLEIEDEVARQSTINFVAAKWSEKDEVSATAWLKQQGIEIE